MRYVSEVPWTMSALGVSEEAIPVVAYWEPALQRHFVVLETWFEALGFSVQADSARVEATHRNERLFFSAVTGVGLRGERTFQLDSTDFFVNRGALYVSFGGLAHFFEPGTLQFDQARLHITNAAATLVLPGTRREAPPLYYGRFRPMLGSGQIDYRLTRTQWQAYDPTYHGFVRTNISALKGRIVGEGLFAQAAGEMDRELRALSYLLDFPRSTALTQVEAGRQNFYGWPRQATYDGIRLSNRPVADRYVHRETPLRGVAPPGAVVAASAGGVVVDRVYADQQGNYLLHVPVYYGSSQVEVEITPVDGGPTTTRRHHLFVSEDMPPPGTLYWDARAGRETIGDQDLLVFAEARYGLAPSLAARAAYLQSGIPMVGLTKSWRGMAVDSEVAVPLASGRPDAARMRFWANSRRARLQVEAAFSENSDWSYYRRRFSSYLGWQFARGTFFLQAARSTTFGEATSTSVTGSSTVRLSPRTTALVTAGGSEFKTAQHSAEPWGLRWGLSVTRTLTRRTRVGLHGEGGMVNDLDFAGASVHGRWRWGTLGLRAGYNQGLAASVTMRVDAPWAIFTNRASKEPGSSTSHSQSIYGSIELGPTPRLSGHARARTGALLQVFVDADRDGRRDAGEMLVDNVDIQVARVQTRQAGPGRVRADLLVPHQQYEVTIDVRTLRNPRLVLTTGERFSFVADPGQTKRIDIPVQKRTIIDGTFDSMARYSAARLVVSFHRNDTEVARAEVSQQGRFSARLVPGTYQIQLSDLFQRIDLRDYRQQLQVVDQPEQVVQLPAPIPFTDN